MAALRAFCDTFEALLAGGGASGGDFGETSKRLLRDYQSVVDVLTAGDGGGMPANAVETMHEIAAVREKTGVCMFGMF